MKGISVIICCYNSGNKLVATLHHLAKQQSLPGISFELIIVDNNCTDNTIILASAIWSSLNTPFLLTIVQQILPGLNYARGMGIKTAHYDYIVLCDDDNWLRDDYLLKIYRLFEAMPEVGLIGGVGEAVMETAAPGWFIELDGFGYAIGTEGRKTGFVASVYGAGMGIRKSVFTQIINDKFSFLLSDRKGRHLSSGGDTEICLLLANAGHKIYLDTSLIFKHFLSSNRLEWSYYLRLRRSFGKAAAYLQLYEPLPERKRVTQFLRLAKFTLSHLKYILFSSYFKNARCADFVQQFSMKLTCLIDNKKMEAVAGRIKTTANKKKLLQHT